MELITKLETFYEFKMAPNVDLEYDKMDSNQELRIEYERRHQEEMNRRSVGPNQQLNTKGYNIVTNN